MVSKPHPAPLEGLPHLGYCRYVCSDDWNDLEGFGAAGPSYEPVGDVTNLLVANGRRSIRSMGLLPASTD